MGGKITLVPAEDGSFDIIIQYDRSDAEFALDFFKGKKRGEGYKSVSDFITKNAKNIKVSAIKIVAAGVLIATIPFMSFMASAADGSRFSMSYLYFGTVQQQMDYVARTNGSIQVVSPSYFDLNPDGSLKMNNVNKTLIADMHAKGIKVVPFLSNHWDRQTGVNAVRNAEALSAQIALNIEAYDLDGVNVDIENLPHTERDAQTELVRLLREKIPAHKEVSVAVAANPYNWQTGWHGSYDYTGLADNSDYLMLMTYDEHYEGGAPGPVASIGFVKDSVRYALSKTTPDKIVVGLPFFGRIWSLHDNSVMGKGISVATINNMIRDYGANVMFDENAQSPKAEFEVKAGDKQYTVGGKALSPGKYVVWYENERSLEEKLKLVSHYDLKGAGSWALGQEDAAIWSSYNTWLNGESTVITPPLEDIGAPEETAPPADITAPQELDPQEEAAEFLPGDVDFDGQITAADARLALRASSRLTELTEEQKRAADMDKDGAVTARDAREILRKSARLE